jgi:hypothetical protein
MSARFPIAKLVLPALALGALPGCATIAGTVGESWNTALVGNQEVPGPGDPDGTGTAKITADAATNTVCYDVTVQRIGTPTAAHLHRGAAGVAGAPVVTFKAPTAGAASECLSVDKTLAAAIIADPSNYYVNVHTADYPSGAIRGQLAR